MFNTVKFGAVIIQGSRVSLENARNNSDLLTLWNHENRSRLNGVKHVLADFVQDVLGDPEAELVRAERFLADPDHNGELILTKLSDEEVEQKLKAVDVQGFKLQGIITVADEHLKAANKVLAEIIERVKDKA